MKKLLFTFALGLLSILASAQSIPTFTDSIYPVTTQYDIKYGSSRNALHLSQNLYMDMYSPVGLEVASPALYLFHGGGFVGGSKNDARLIVEAKFFAGCGYTVFVCDYRIGWRLTYNDTARAIKNSHVAYYRAVADGFTAIRYGKYYANILNLDTSNFFIAGTSAGGLISVGVGYLDQNEVESYYATPIKSSGNALTQYENTDVKGVISYWGGGFDTTIFVNETTPNICFHGALDEVVYYNEGRYKGVIPIYGGYKVNKLSDENNIPSILHTFPNAHHGVSVTSLQWDSCLNETKYWMAELINPVSNNISVPTTPRRVLSELICATTCGPCATFDPQFESFMATNSAKVTYTEKHTHIPSADNYYLQSNPYSQWYMNFNQIVANPVFFWDGKFHFTNDANQACFDSIQAKPSYLQISGTYHLNSVKDSIFITVNLNPLANISGNLYLHTNVKFTDPAHHDAYAFSGVYGETAIADLIANNGVSYTFKQKIPTTFTVTYNKDSLKVLIYVQTHTNSNPNVNDPPTHEVFNSTYAVKTGVTYPVLNVANVIGNNICPLSGFVNLTTTGGSGIYTYNWSTGATTEDITGIGSGTYTCTITSTDNQVVAGTYNVANIAIGNVNGISVTALAGGKIKVTCSSVPNANKYQYQYRLTGATAWSNKEVSNTTVTFSNLLHSTSYQVRMRARCKTGTIYKNGQWSATYVVTTLANRIEEPIAPVITDNIIYVYDIYGRLMYKGLETPNTTNYINGIYFFKVNGLVTRKIIIN